MSSPLPLLRRTLRLSAPERRQAGRALVWLLLARGVLRVLSFRAVERLVGRLPARAPSLDVVKPDECGRALRRAAQLLPGISCLARGLAAQCLLRREGLPATLHLGVRLDPVLGFQAHAWVESGGIVVTGGDEAPAYSPLARAPAS